MKITIPFFVFETLQTVNEVLEVIFRGNPENDTCLSRIFIPRKIETKSVDPGTVSARTVDFADRIRMWANGVYIETISEGYQTSRFGNQYETEVIRIRARTYQMGDPVWIEFDVGVRDLLLAEKNARNGISEDDPGQIQSREKQKAALEAIHSLIKQH